MTYAITLDSPIGPLLIETNDKALTHISLPQNGRQPSEAPSIGELRKEEGAPEILEEVVRQLTEYFAGERTEFDLPIELDGTEFQRDVWTSLAEIPYGKTVSYADLATMVGRPSAFRAVGQANGANPIPIVLPCHRVIASGGGIGGYGGGLPMKRQLLGLEGRDGFQV